MTEQNRNERRKHLFEQDLTGEIPQRLNPVIYTPTQGKEAGILNLVEGKSPFAPPPEYDAIRDLVHERAKRYTGEYVTPDMEQADSHIRERFPDMGDSTIEYHEGGIAGALEKIFSHAIELRPGIGLINAAGVSFPEVPTYVLGKKSVFYVPISPPLNSSPQEYLDFLLEESMHKSKIEGENVENISYYVPNPNCFTGLHIPLPILKDFILSAQELNRPVFVDEAYADWKPDSESIIPFLKEVNNGVALRGFSKGAGLPNEKLAVSVWSKDLYDEIWKPIRRLFPITPRNQEFLKEMLNPSILIPFFEEKRPMVRALNTEFVELVQEAGAMVLPNDLDVPVTAIYYSSLDFCDQLEKKGLKVARGSDYLKTHQAMSDKYARIPTKKTIEEVRAIAAAVGAVINSIKDFHHEIRNRFKRQI